MDWDDLRIFLAIARAGTLSAAGKRLSLDATTVARRLARLEARIDRTLFELTPTGHTLTPRGTELLVHAEAMESAALASFGDGSATGAHPGGTVRVSVSEGFGGSIVAPNLAGFAAANPDLAIELVAWTGFLSPSRRETDVAIMLARPKSGPLIVRKLTDYRLGLYGAHGSSPRLEGVGDLLNQILVGYVPDLIYAPELGYLDDVDPGLSAAITSTSVSAQATIIRSGAGLGILPCFIGDADPRLTRLLRDEIDIVRSFWLVIHRDLRGVSRVTRFVDWLDATIAELRPLFEGVQR